MITKKEIELMIKEGKKRNAPVLRIKKEIGANRLKRLIFVILSTRTKDEKTIEATNKLFKDINNIRELLNLSEEEIEKRIYGVAFYKIKSKKIKDLAKILIEKYKGNIPEKFSELIKLPGIGRKVANVYLADVLNKKVIGVDVHVHRISNRLGIVKTKSPEETEKELMKKIDKRLWNKINIAMVAYGQTICKAKPKCEECPLRNKCKYYHMKKN